MHADVKARKILGRRGPMDKAIVAAVLERGGRVRAAALGKIYMGRFASMLNRNPRCIRMH